ncbi:MAG TPA: LPXTG cell wall anchor domain-containing protein [Nocardioidaceae bacterium]|nr:LPXTG cell wall anchor domain-containing protein [Nocardioidaceae bacterium]
MTRHALRLAGVGSIAVAATSPLWCAPAAYAGCGEEAVPAVYDTIVHPDVWVTQPAVTHSEWLWTRQVSTFEVELSRVVTAAYNLIGWSRVIDTLEYEYSRVVVDQPAVPPVPPTAEVGHWETQVVTPAVYQVLYEFVHRNGQVRWEPPEWNSNSNPSSNGWLWSGNTQQVLITPEVTQQVWVVDAPATPGTPGTPAVTHVETDWALSDPGGSWVATGASRVANSVTENETLPEGQTPAGSGWVNGGIVGTVGAVLQFQWIPDTDPTPAGWTPTGNSQVSGSVTETTPTTSAAAPGQGWSPVQGSEVVVVDRPAQQVLQTPGYNQQVLVSPAVDATEPCLVLDQTNEPEPEPATLPATGNDIPAWLPAAGVLSMAAGVVFVVPRRRRTEAS